MTNQKTRQFNVTIPVEYFSRLNKLAAIKTLDDPDRPLSASKLGRMIVCEYIDQNSPLVDEQHFEAK